MENVEQPLNIAQKIMDLSGGDLRFKYEFDTPKELLAVGAHNNAELERIGTIGPEIPDRLWDLICLLIVEALPLDVMNGKDPKAALRQFLLDKLSQPKYGWERIRWLAREAFAAGGFTADQLESLYLLFDAMPGLVIDEIVESVFPLILIPKTASPKLTGILVEMLEEAKKC